MVKRLKIRSNLLKIYFIILLSLNLLLIIMNIKINA